MVCSILSSDTYTGSYGSENPVNQALIAIKQLIDDFDFLSFDRAFGQD